MEAVNEAPESSEPAADEPTGGADVGAAVARHQALNAVGDFLGRILGALDARDLDSQANSLHMSLKIRIVQSTFSSLALMRIETPLPELAVETLDALAEQEQEPVSQVA